MPMSGKGKDSRLHDAAQRIARACRFVVQGCLREEEWRDADEAFAEVILVGLEKLNNETNTRTTKSASRTDG